MPRKDQTGPPKTSQVTRTCQGQGTGRQTNRPGTGRQKGGKKGKCR